MYKIQNHKINRLWFMILRFTAIQNMKVETHFLTPIIPNYHLPNNKLFFNETKSDVSERKTVILDAGIKIRIPTDVHFNAW